MKDDFHGFAHYAPGYLYESIRIVPPVQDEFGLRRDRFGDRFQEYDDYESTHLRFYYSVGFKYQDVRDNWKGCEYWYD